MSNDPNKPGYNPFLSGAGQPAPQQPAPPVQQPAPAPQQVAPQQPVPQHSPQPALAQPPTPQEARPAAAAGQHQATSFNPFLDQQPAAKPVVGGAAATPAVSDSNIQRLRRRTRLTAEQVAVKVQEKVQETGRTEDSVVAMLLSEYEDPDVADWSEKSDEELAIERAIKDAEDFIRLLTEGQPTPQDSRDARGKLAVVRNYVGDPRTKELPELEQHLETLRATARRLDDAINSPDSLAAVEHLGGGGSKLPIIIVALVLLLAGGGAAYYFLVMAK